jgi:RHS repeat-associated protein
MRLRHLFIKASTVVVAVSLAASTISASAVPDERGPTGPDVQHERSVPGRPVPVAPIPPLTQQNATVIPVVWPAAGRAEVDVASVSTAKAGAVDVGMASADKAKPAKIAVETFDQEAAKKAGLAGVLLRVSDAGGAAGADASIRLDYSGFAQAYGGDFGSRLALASYPSCVLTTPEKPECRIGTPLKSINDAKSKHVSAAVPLSGGDAGQTRTASAGTAAVASGTVVAATAGPAGSGGDYAATSLAPSGSWSGGGSSGDFGYSLPLPMPAAPGGSAPSPALVYSSGSVDGRTSATNSQASWVGDGWDLSAGGFIERRYTSCAFDAGGNQGSTQTGDQCWKGEEFSVALGGMSGKMVKDNATGLLRPEKDDGSRIERLGGAANGDDNGEYWKVTSVDGTQYFLGLNRLPGWNSGKPETRSTLTVPVYGNHAGEPCHQAAFANSSCTQAYRWNVDMIVDPHGNAMTFYYDQEINHYKRGGVNGTDTPYVAAGRLNRIEYGLRGDAVYAAAPAKVTFDVAERCLPSGQITCDPAQLTAGNAASWPDVPFDRICAAGENCTGRYSPSFFTRKRLTKIRTESLTGAGFRDVDSWSLRQEFPPTGDGNPQSLWLAGVTRAGHVNGTASLPEIQFFGLPMDNRVDAIDGYLPITRYRVTRVVGEAGAVTEVAYAPHECVRPSHMPANPETNTYRCYPTYWTPPNENQPILDWFHKYVVANVTEDARTGGPSMVKTEYQYLDGAAWHYDQDDEEEANRRTWSEWRGFGRVRTLLGDPSEPRTLSESRFLRGMDGDTLPGGGARDVWVTDGDGGVIEDEKRLQGFTRETLVYSGGQVVTATVNEPHLIETANDGTDTAYMLRIRSASSRSKQEDGSWRRTRTTSTYNNTGLADKIEDEGDIAVAGDESCTQGTYLRNDNAWILVHTSSVRTIAKPCSAWPGTDADVVSDVRSFYDGQGFGAAPTRGVITESQRWIGGSNYQTVATTKVDAYGRVTETTDVDGVKTTTAYTPSTGNPTTVATTNRAGWLSTSTVDTVRGVPLAEDGLNGERADLEYDPLGRLVKVWAPGRAKAAGKSPTAEYAYDYHTDAPTVVTSKAIKENETYAVSYDLYDGMLRQRQTQTPALGGGRILSDNFYDSRGNEVKVNSAYYNTDPPSAALLGVLDNAVPNQTVTEFDDLGRVTETIMKIRDVEQWRTKTRYGGDNTYTTPPQGGVATSVIKNAKGQVTQRRQYHVPSPSGVYGAGATFDPTSFAYDAKGALAKVTDVQGNEWKYEYDVLGRKTADVDPDHGRTTHGYDAWDQLTSATDARNKTLTFTYDALGRKTATFEGPTKLAEWTYDTLRKGALTSSTRYVAGNAYQQKINNYDGLGRPTSSSVVIPAAEGNLAGTYTFGASYSSVTGQVLAETMPAAGGLAAENVIHTYNDLGLPESTYGLNTYASEHMYSPYGETLRTTLGVSPNKVWVSSAYEEGTRRLANVQVKRDTTTQSQVTNRTFGYDAAGNVLKVADAPTDGPADTQCFTYDALRRMTSAWTPKTHDCATTKSVANMGGAAPFWHDFTFDKVGNRTTQVQHAATGDVTETYEIPGSGPTAVRPHSLTSVTRVSPSGTAKDDYTYDAAGNTATRKIGGNTQTLEWNAEGRTSKVTESDGKKSEYIYDADGNRLIKKEPTAATLYLPGQEVILPTGASSTSGKRYYLHGGVAVAMRSSVNGLQYLLGDHHGTDDVAITASNLFVTRRYSDPFGNPRGTAPRVWPDDKGFIGGIKDSSGLTSIGAREYDSRTGRFISIDPVMDTGDPQQVHGYSYANNNPATYSDPTGLCPAMFAMLQACDAWNLMFGTPEQSKAVQVANFRENEKRKNTENSKAQAASELGMSDDDVRKLKEDSKSDKGFWGVIVEELPDIIGDLTGFNDVRDCFTKLDLWACAGIIPWAKVFKLVKSASKIYDAVRKALKWEERVAEATSRLRKLEERTEALVRAGQSKLDDLVKKFDDSLSCAAKHSFPPGTLVLMADGSTKPIEQVKLGEFVVATDPTTGETSPRQVTATWVHGDEFDRAELVVDTGDATETITATDWHPFWAADLNAWVPISELKVGSWLRTAAGTLVQAVSIRRFTGSGVVHDLTVEGVHTYHVLAGAAPLLVHNNDCPVHPVGLHGGSFTVTNPKVDPSECTCTKRGRGSENKAEADEKQTRGANTTDLDNGRRTSTKAIPDVIDGVREHLMNGDPIGVMLPVAAATVVTGVKLAWQTSAERMKRRR